MLQQTQVPRVSIKFPAFLSRFPTLHDLAHASLTEVILAWQGLGYNRRAKYLLETARILQDDFHGTIPQDPQILVRLPGIGPATAASLIVFTYNIPLVFIETNIRRTFIHHFFSEECTIHDRDIVPLLEATLDRENPREWYYALMDYGSHLGKTIPNPNAKSVHYAMQKPFRGSDRELRGNILRMLGSGACQFDMIVQKLNEDPSRVEKILQLLQKEGMICEDNYYWNIASV